MTSLTDIFKGKIDEDEKQIKDYREGKAVLAGGIKVGDDNQTIAMIAADCEARKEDLKDLQKALGKTEGEIRKVINDIKKNGKVSGRLSCLNSAYSEVIIILKRVMGESK